MSAAKGDKLSAKVSLQLNEGLSDKLPNRPMCSTTSLTRINQKQKAEASTQVKGSPKKKLVVTRIQPERKTKTKRKESECQASGEMNLYLHTLPVSQYGQLEF